MDLAEEGDDIIVGFDQEDMLHFVLIKRGTPGHMGTVMSWTKFS